MYTKKIIIIGCGRSGTGYIHKFFQRAGLDFGHEVEMQNGQSNHYKTFDDLSEYDVILHQIREPLKVISSLQTFREDTWNYFYPRIKK